MPAVDNNLCEWRAWVPSRWAPRPPGADEHGGLPQTRSPGGGGEPGAAAATAHPDSWSPLDIRRATCWTRCTRPCGVKAEIIIMRRSSFTWGLFHCETQTQEPLQSHGNSYCGAFFLNSFRRQSRVNRQASCRLEWIGWKVCWFFFYNAPKENIKSDCPFHWNSPVEGLSDVAPLIIPRRILQPVHRRCNFKNITSLKLSVLARAQTSTVLLLAHPD